MGDTRQEEPEAMVKRLVQMTNAHDLDGIVDCFTTDYRNETPAHPSQGFVGREQVRKNWEQILRFMPDITVRVLRCRGDGDVVWSEWEMAGTRPDGSAHLMVGVILFGVRQGQASWARFYLEPVEAAGVDVNTAVRQNVGAQPTGAGRSDPEVKA
jgi:ketosteroid isomerase-like protein